MRQHPGSTLLMIVMAVVGLLVWLSMPVESSLEQRNARPLDARDSHTIQTGKGPTLGSTDFVQVEGEGPSTRTVLATTLLPLRIRLELVRASLLDRTPSVPPLGAGRDARMSGQLSGERGEPFLGEVIVIAGPNRGRMAATDAAGRFHMAGLYPGLALVDVRRAGQTLARREVRLDASQKAHLHIAFGQRASVAGRVVDADGHPIHSALVRVDGRLTRSDLNGHFFVGEVAAGQVTVETQATGYALDRRECSLLAGPSSSVREFEVQLRPEARLRLTAVDAKESDLTTLWILPGTVEGAREQPWAHYAPLQFNGSQFEVRGLPPGPIIVHADRRGARLDRGAMRLQLSAGAEHQVDLPFVPAATLEGTVTDAGVGVEGARLELLAPDPLLATKTALGLQANFEHLELLPLVSPMATHATSGPSGAFAMNRPLSAWQRLLVSTPASERRVERAVQSAAAKVDVQLDVPQGERARLSIVPSAHNDDLPFEVFVHGKLRQSGSLKSGEAITLDQLEVGEWQVRMTQGLRELVHPHTVHLDGDMPLRVELIP